MRGGLLFVSFVGFILNLNLSEAGSGPIVGG